MTILPGPTARVNATYMCKNLLKIGSIGQDRQFQQFTVREIDFLKARFFPTPCLFVANMHTMVMRSHVKKNKQQPWQQDFGSGVLSSIPHISDHSPRTIFWVSINFVLIWAIIISIPIFTMGFTSLRPEIFI